MIRGCNRAMYALISDNVMANKCVGYRPWSDYGTRTMRYNLTYILYLFFTISLMQLAFITFCFVGFITITIKINRHVERTTVVGSYTTFFLPSIRNVSVDKQCSRDRRIFIIMTTINGDGRIYKVFKC